MLIYVRTRGRPRKLDYQFLGTAPEDFWWRAYHSVTDVERPTILLRSDGAAWQAYVSGILSERLDSTEIVIQFNVALAGVCGAGDDNALALRIISGSAAGLAHRAGESIPGDPIDKQLSADEVERMLETPGPESLAQAADAIRAAYAVNAPAPAPAPGTPGAVPDGDWVGGLVDESARDAFTALAARLLDGQAGRALTLNLVDAPEDLDELPAWAGSAGVLSARSGRGLGLEVRSRGKAEPSREAQLSLPGRHRSGRPAPHRSSLAASRSLLVSRSQLLTVTGVTVLVVALVMVTIWLTVWS